MNSLNRFIEASNNDYEKALNEIKRGRKTSHWIWYIFPQIKGLGFSSTSVYYSINNIGEAKSFLNNSILKNRLIEISTALYNLNTNNANEVLGNIDALKVKSCMTLFDYIDPSIKVFNDVINKYYNGEKDNKTIEILNNMNM